MQDCLFAVALFCALLTLGLLLCLLCILAKRGMPAELRRKRLFEVCDNNSVMLTSRRAFDCLNNIKKASRPVRAGFPEVNHCRFQLSISRHCNIQPLKQKKPAESHYKRRLLKQQNTLMWPRRKSEGRPFFVVTRTEENGTCINHKKGNSVTNCWERWLF